MYGREGFSVWTPNNLYQKAQIRTRKICAGGCEYMPKTRDAFALKDFDRARILQRPFFKDFHFDKDLTDAKILSSLSAQIGDSILELERKNETLSKVHDKLHEYARRLLNHVDRLRRYYQDKDKQSVEFRRARNLDVMYSIDIIPALWNFEHAVMVKLIDLRSALYGKYKEIFTERLKEARLKKGLSRRDLASQIGYTEGGYGQIETGRNEPNLKTLRVLSRCLNLSVDSLLGLA